VRDPATKQLDCWGFHHRGAMRAEAEVRSTVGILNIFRSVSDAAGVGIGGRGRVRPHVRSEELKIGMVHEVGSRLGWKTG